MRQACRGFTLLEVMVVMVLVGVLLGMVGLATGSTPRAWPDRRPTP